MAPLLPFKFCSAGSARVERIRGRSPRGLRLSDADLVFQPHYADFMCFAVTISAGSQTSDVAVVSTAMRRLVLAHSLTSFAFNTAVLAFTVNVAASLS